MQTSWSKRLYRTGVEAYHLGIRMAGPFSSKAKEWRSGRKETANQLKAFKPAGRVCWIHCASVGEFEQGRPLLEHLKHQHPDLQIVLTFYSPSGFLLRRNYQLADLVTYLPADSPENARMFLDAIQPELAVFVKYEFWGSYLEELRTRDISTFLASGIFRKDQPFFRRWGSYHRSLLHCFEKILVQDDASSDLLKSIGIEAVVCPDLRFDRVLQIAASSPEVGLLKEMSAHRIILAGSTWPEDEQNLARAYYRSWKEQGFKLVIAPHEPDNGHIRKILRLFKGDAVLMSQANLPLCPSVLIIDTVGLLSSIYRYAWACYIGGGFGKGIHNTLEAAVFGKPLAFGPNFEKFAEARALQEMGAAKVVYSMRDLTAWTDGLRSDPQRYEEQCHMSQEYVQGNSGGTACTYSVMSPYLSAEA